MQVLRILVVEDEAAMQQAIARALREYKVAMPDLDAEVGFSVETADSGEAAMDLIGASRPDILLLDHKLPGMTGLDLLEKLADTKNGMVTVMVTAYASLDTAITAIKKGAYDFLAKPFTPLELRAVVSKAARNVMLTRQARQLAEEKRRIRFEFISVLAHELKSPLAAVEGYLHIVRERNLGEDQAAYDQMLDRSLVRLEGMRKMINDLLDLTRIESGQRKRELADIDVAQVGRTVVETFGPEALKRGITIELNAGQPVPMRADQGEIEIILNNLVSNAIKYNRDNGKVCVEISSEEGMIFITVGDTGIGMTKEETERLFADFVRIKNEKTRNILGSGLGLSILKKLANLYGGDVSVMSEPGEGTAFTVTLKKSS